MSNSLDVLGIAKICHEINKTLCEQFGDDSQVHWEDAPEWQKDSAVKGVIFNIANPDSVPEDSHLSWMEEKIKTGWTYGDTKCEINKTHPCMVDYKDLPVEQQLKDHLFSTIVKTLSKDK